MKKVFWTGILAGVVILISNMIVGAIFQFFQPAIKDQYMTAIFRPWSDYRMSLFFLHPFIVGLVLSYIWGKTRNLFTNLSKMRNGFNFGLLAWIFLTIPGMYVTYTTFAVSVAMILSWTAGGLVGMVWAGLILAKLNN
jgi:hypothetical protein